MRMNDFSQSLNLELILSRVDIILNNNHNDSIYQAHSPSLGCCGLCEKECNVLVYPLQNKTKKAEKAYKKAITSLLKQF